MTLGAVLPFADFLGWVFTLGQMAECSINYMLDKKVPLCIYHGVPKISLYNDNEKVDDNDYFIYNNNR